MAYYSRSKFVAYGVCDTDFSSNSVDVKVDFSCLAEVVVGRKIDQVFMGNLEEIHDLEKLKSEGDALCGTPPSPQWLC
jgi:hypothetical protein